MAARKNKGTKDQPWSEKVKEKIQASMLVNRLVDHALGKVDLSQTQVRSIEILLKKTLPDLSAVSATVDANSNVYAVTDKPITREDWARTHGAALVESATRSPNGPH